MQALFIIGLIVIAILFGPILLIWSLNTLFGLHIFYGIQQFLAALVIIALFCRK